MGHLEHLLISVVGLFLKTSTLLLPGESVSLETQNELLALLAYYGMGNRYKGDSTKQRRQDARSSEATELEAQVEHDGDEGELEKKDLLELKEMEEKEMNSDSSTDGICYVALASDPSLALRGYPHPASVCLQYYQHMLVCSTSAAKISCWDGLLFKPSLHPCYSATWYHIVVVNSSLSHTLLTESWPGLLRLLHTSCTN